MKILHIMPGFELGYPGGVTNYVRTLAESQIRRGIEVTVLCSPQAEYLVPKGLAIYPYIGPREKVFSFTMSRRNALDAQMLDFIQGQKFDVLHFHSIYGLSQNFLNSVATSGMPYVFSVHDYYAFCPRIYMLNKQGQPCREFNPGACSSCVGLLETSDILRAIEKRFTIRVPTIRSNTVIDRQADLTPFFNQAARVLAVSDRVGELFHQAYPTAIVSTAHIGNVSASWGEITKTSSNTIRVSFIGTLNVHKGGRVLLDIMKACTRPDIEFHFYGRVTPTFNAELANSRLINHGGYSPGDLKKILSDTDLGLVLPIWEDNGPQVVMEIINSGTPILATRVGGIPDFVSIHTGYLFDPDSHEEKRQAAEWLNGVTLKELRDMAAQITPLTTPESHEQDLYDLYRSLSIAEAA